MSQVLKKLIFIIEGLITIKLLLLEQSFSSPKAYNYFTNPAVEL